RRGSGEAASEFACAWPKKNTDASAKKLTRPDGEIRAGRVDRRRGSGGRERRSGLEFRPWRPVRPLVSAGRPKVQADSGGSGGNFLPPAGRPAIAVLKENTSDFKPLVARSGSKLWPSSRSSPARATRLPNRRRPSRPGIRGRCPLGPRSRVVGVSGPAETACLPSSGRPVWGVSSAADQGPSGAGALRPITGLALLPRGDEADDLRFCLHLPDDLADLVLRQFGFGETDAVELAAHIQRSLDHRGLVGAEEVGDVVCGRLRGKAHDGIGAFAGRARE